MSKFKIFYICIIPVLIMVSCSQNNNIKVAGGSEETNTTGIVNKNPNAVDIPASVRKNLDMTFASAERRIIEGVIRVPGEFELRPEARHEYHAMLEGRIRLHVRQFDFVKAGTKLASLDSPAWRDIQHSAVEAEGEIRVAEANLDVAEARLSEVRKALSFHEQRLVNLNSAGVKNITLEEEIHSLRNQIPRLEAEWHASVVALEEANEHYRSRLRTMASVTGLSRDELLDESKGTDAGIPYWHTIDELILYAESDGVVDSIASTDGAWMETGELVLLTVDPEKIRFAARAPQSDLGEIKSGQTARIVPPDKSAADESAIIQATINVGYQGHAEERIIPVYAIPEIIKEWARPGISAYLEIVTEKNAEPVLSIPENSLVRDELELIFFRRNPKNPDEVLRVKADMGLSDGRWIEVKSGITDGDEVVVNGAYALKLAGGDMSSPDGYHYHADGSLHKDH